MRTPISGVRCDTVCDITPKIPTAVSSSARPANAENNHAATRVRHIASPTRSSIVLTSASGRFESSCLTSWRIAATRLA